MPRAYRARPCTARSLVCIAHPSIETLNETFSEVMQRRGLTRSCSRRTHNLTLSRHSAPVGPRRLCRAVPWSSMVKGACSTIEV